MIIGAILEGTRDSAADANINGAAMVVFRTTQQADRWGRLMSAPTAWFGANNRFVCAVVNTTTNERIIYIDGAPT